MTAATRPDGPGPRLGVSLRASQRLAVMGRMRMAQWIEMPERDFAREVARLEKDPLFRKLFFGASGLPAAIRRQRWPGSRASAGLLELNEALLAGGEPVRVEQHLLDRAKLVAKIRKMGAEAFERYFLRGEEGLSLPEVARRTGLSETEARATHDLLLEIGAEAEFFRPPPGARHVPGYACLARLSVEEGEPRYEFLSLHWARGLYQVRHDFLDQWRSGEALTGDERRRLRHLLKRVEILNLRQSTLYRVLETVTQLHADYLRTRREDLRRPMSLRMLARRLDLAPSTVCRALAGRSVLLPWGEEASLIRFAPGRRAILRDVLKLWLEAPDRKATDARLAERLRSEYGIAVSRRTVNAVRNEILHPRSA